MTLDIDMLNSLASAAGWHGGYQNGAATCLVAVKRHRDAVDQHLRVALGDHAVVVPSLRTTAAVALARHSHSHDGAVGRGREYLASVAGWVVQTDYAAHGFASSDTYGPITT